MKTWTFFFQWRTRILGQNRRHLVKRFLPHKCNNYQSWESNQQHFICHRIPQEFKLLQKRLAQEPHQQSPKSKTSSSESKSAIFGFLKSNYKNQQMQKRLPWKLNQQPFVYHSKLQKFNCKNVYLGSQNRALRLPYPTAKMSKCKNV